jgi:hypothetical protein
MTRPLTWTGSLPWSSGSASAFWKRQLSRQATEAASPLGPFTPRARSRCRRRRPATSPRSAVRQFCSSTLALGEQYRAEASWVMHPTDFGNLAALEHASGGLTFPGLQGRRTHDVRQQGLRRRPATNAGRVGEEPSVRQLPPRLRGTPGEGHQPKTAGGAPRRHRRRRIPAVLEGRRETPVAGGSNHRRPFSDLGLSAMAREHCRSQEGQRGVNGANRLPPNGRGNPGSSFHRAAVHPFPSPSP